MNAWVSALLVAVCVAGALARSPLEQPAEPISPSEQAAQPLSPSEQAAEPLSPWEQPAEPLSPWEQPAVPNSPSELVLPPAPVEALDWLPNGCPARGDVPWLLPGWFCHHYWSCSNGKKIPMRCPRGLHFNRLLQVCDYPESAGCRFIVWPWNKV